MKTWINHKIDMLVYRIWYRRWKRKFIAQPHMLVPFMDTMTRWAEKTLTPKQIEECRQKWRGIAKKNPATQHGYE
jgi:hypothetical protein